MSITTIILTKNEETNIKAAIESAELISSRILVIDCGSEDKTVDIAKSLGAEIYFHEWLGHAKQFNWALDNCDIKTPWVFRLDADERISEELAKEINNKIQNTQVDGYEMRWRIYFMNKWIKHGGTHKPYFLRLFRYGKGRVEERLMDEEGMTKTANDLINIGKPIEFDEDKFIKQLEELMNAAYQEREDIRDLIAEVVPTYHAAGRHGTEFKGEAYKEQIAAMAMK